MRDEPEKLLNRLGRDSSCWGCACGCCPPIQGMDVKKKPSLAKLKRKLDKVFSEWIRKRDGDRNGMGHCISCGEWALLQAGHFIPRQHNSVRFNEHNVAGQCSRCNCWLHGNQAEFYVALVKKHGQEVVDELMRLKRTTVKMTRIDYEALIEKYSQPHQPTSVRST